MRVFGSSSSFIDPEFCWEISHLCRLDNILSGYSRKFLYDVGVRLYRGEDLTYRQICYLRKVLFEFYEASNRPLINSVVELINDLDELGSLHRK